VLIHTSSENRKRKCLGTPNIAAELLVGKNDTIWVFYNLFPKLESPLSFQSNNKKKRRQRRKEEAIEPAQKQP